MVIDSTYVIDELHGHIGGSGEDVYLHDKGLELGGDEAVERRRKDLDNNIHSLWRDAGTDSEYNSKRSKGKLERSNGSKPVRGLPERVRKRTVDIDRTQFDDEHNEHQSELGDDILLHGKVSGLSGDDSDQS